jgi:catechol 2,3-dioxygenase-like lactoylglutathione lyase family enzyme
MQATIEDLVDGFERRRLTRRQLVASLAALAAGAVPAAAQPGQGPVAQGGSLNHVSVAVTDVERSAEFYKRVLGLKEVSRPGNGGINLGLGSSFLGLYRLPDPGKPNHFCIGVNDYNPDQIADRLHQINVQATVDRNPAKRTSGGDQLYFTDPDNTRVQLSANGYQG